MRTPRMRNVVMLVVLIVWGIYIVRSLNAGHVPDAVAWGVPGGVYVALYRPWQKRQDPNEEKPE